ncbi:MAG: M23 family metallopeptidase [Anaerolineales bacterium]|nr:M23 family metallopeptidase [Anaerolineales bacterium]
MENNMILSWPVDAEKYPLTQGFGENPEAYAVYKQAGHNGIDLGCPMGTPVCAAAGGVVVHTGFDKNGYGKYVRVSHEKFETLYAHLSEIEVKPRQALHTGDRLGLSGSTGHSTGPHLHFELRIPWEPIAGYPGGARDPMPYLKAVNRRSSAVSQKSETSRDAVMSIEPGKSVRVTAADGLIIRREPGGEALGAARWGDVFEAAHTKEEWVGVVVYVHANWLQPEAQL